MMSSILLVLMSYNMKGTEGAVDCFDYDVDYFGFDLEDGVYDSVASALDCQHSCQNKASCQFWTWDQSYHGACWRKSALGEARKSPGLISGPRYCGDVTTANPGGELDSIRVMSYNLYGWNALQQNPWKAENIYKAIRATNPDLLGTQEIENLAAMVASNIGDDYMVAGGAGSAGHAILYRSSVFSLDGTGVAPLFEEDQWGPRTVEWVQLTHRLSGQQVDHFNTHLCVCNADQLLGSATTILDVMTNNRRPGSRILLTGDFNVFDGFENSKAIKFLKDVGQMEDTFRAFNTNGEDGTTFPGAGKIDYILTEDGVGVKNAWIDHTYYGEASDHLPVAAVVDL